MNSNWYEKTCLCGCDGAVKQNKQYINGHNSKGKKHSPETRAKMSYAIKIAHAHLETRVKLSVAKKGKNNPACRPEVRAKISAAKKDKKHSPETRAKMSAAQKGNKKLLGHKHSLETRAKMSAAMKGTKHSPETLAKRGAAIKASYARPEAKVKLMQRILEGRIQTRGKSGYYWSDKNSCNLHYASSYELLAYKILEELSEVKSYERCPYVIDYTYNDKNHKYLPDIFITWCSGKKEILEVKANWQINKCEKTKAKIEAGKKFAKNKGLIFSVWGEDKLKC